MYLKFYLIVLFLVLSCQKKETQIYYPQKIGKKNIVSKITGDSAKFKIDALHNSAISSEFNAIIYYDKNQRDVLYVSKYRDQQKAHDQLLKMIEKMKNSKNFPFSHIIGMKSYENCYMALGLGLVHYIYKSKDFLIWYSTEQKFYNKLPDDLIKIYPAKLNSYL